MFNKKLAPLMEELSAALDAYWRDPGSVPELSEWTPAYRLRWPGNVNPDCTAAARCGDCRKDVCAQQAHEKWARRSFQPRTRWDGWSRDEVDLVRRMAGDFPPSEILAALHAECGTKRTTSGLNCMAFARSIRLGRRGYGTNELAGFFGVSLDLVVDWIHRGRLRATQWHGRQWSYKPVTEGKKPYIVSREDAEAFIRGYPWLYDFGLTDPAHPLYAVAQAANRGERWLGAKQMAELLGLSEQHTGELARRGILRCERRGTVLMFRESDTREFRDLLARRKAAHQDFLRGMRRRIAA